MTRSQPSPEKSPEALPGHSSARIWVSQKPKSKRNRAETISIRARVHRILGGAAMPQPPPAGPYPNVRRSPRFFFDALVGVVVPQLDKPQQFWSRSTDISQGGIGVNLIGGDLNPDEVASLQIPLPKQHNVDLRGAVRCRISLHCGFAFVDLGEGQRNAVRLACEALARLQTRETRTS
jgi:hypothetical protein